MFYLKYFGCFELYCWLFCMSLRQLSLSLLALERKGLASVVQKADTFIQGTKCVG